MTELHQDFDLCFDLKTTDNLQKYIETFDNPKSVMQMMLREIRSRDKIIAELKEEVIMFDIVSKAHQELVGELMVPTAERDKTDKDGSYPPIILNSDTQVFAKEGDNTSFCRYCGAGIPHRPGEGRCGKCMHHFNEPTMVSIDHVEFYPNKDETFADKEQRLRETSPFEAKKEKTHKTYIQEFPTTVYDEMRALNNPGRDTFKAKGDIEKSNWPVDNGVEDDPGHS